MTQEKPLLYNLFTSVIYIIIFQYLGLLSNLDRFKIIHIFIWQESIGNKSIIGGNISQSKSSAKDVGWGGCH